eukprot:COSAG01_NODE_64149_length_277_cov_1.168539_2_plen_50_part_01
MATTSAVSSWEATAAAARRQSTMRAIVQMIRTEDAMNRNVGNLSHCFGPH